jgi:hypothetical protein
MMPRIRHNHSSLARLDLGQDLLTMAKYPKMEFVT